MPASASKIKVLLVDDHYLVREGIRSSLRHYPFIAVVGEAAEGAEAVELVKQLAPHVVLMDINMPGMNGLEATALIRARHPATKVIALTMHDKKEYVLSILRAGADGYVLKDTSPQELSSAIQAVVKGDAFFSPGVSHLLLENLVRASAVDGSGNELVVSAREQEMLQQIALGRTNKDIARLTNLSVRTVETYRLRLMRKLQARNVAELLKEARARQLLE